MNRAPRMEKKVEDLLEKARREAELAQKAKNEFLSNISHELRTPLNIIIGMLNMAAEDEGVPPETRKNLALAREAAEGLFSQINDLILLSNLEARRLKNETAPFSPKLLLESLAHKFAASAEKKRIRLEMELDEFKDGIFEGGYNLIHLAMEKLIHNAIKFSSEGGRALMRAGVILRDAESPWLTCEVLDEGPGLCDFVLEGGADLFRQGDASLNRQHGGLGLGLHLAASLVELLGGEMRLSNRREGGARPGFDIPIKFSAIAFNEHE